MKKPQVTFAFVLAHAWVLMIFFGALVFDTLIVYPKYLPRRTPLARNRDGVRNCQGSGRLLPAPRFRQLDHRCRVPDPCLACEACPVLDYRQPDRDGLRRIVSMANFWPRNTIMFTEGTAVHSVAFLKQTAQGVRGGTLDTVRPGLSGSDDVVHGVLEVLPLQDSVPVRASISTGNKN